MKPSWGLVLIALVILIGTKLLDLPPVGIGVMFVGACFIYLLLIMED